MVNRIQCGESGGDSRENGRRIIGDNNCQQQLLSISLL